jgi:MOSC domain-containing protein YiiM
MPIEMLCIAGQEAGPIVAVETVEVVAGQGIVGDRNYGRRKYPGQNLTLVEAEEIERFSRAAGAAIALSATRRNLVTRGVRLNALVGTEFSIGSVRLRGVELCEPCAALGKSLAQPKLTAAAAVRALTHRCGLRADVLSSGTISRGDEILS